MNTTTQTPVQAQAPVQQPQTQIAKQETAQIVPETPKEFFLKPATVTRLVEAIGDETKAKKLCSILALQVQTDENLKGVSMQSVLMAAIDCANFGLIPNKLTGHAYIIPYNNYNKETKQTIKEAQLQIGYKGYVKKFYEEGFTVEVELVTKKELEEGRFKEQKGTHSSIYYSPDRMEVKTEKNIALGYCILRKPNFEPISITMNLEEIIETAKTDVWAKDSAGKSFKERKLKGVWVSGERETDFAEMCKKTLLRRVAKISPVDVCVEMSSYEAERDARIMRDVTPQKQDVHNIMNANVNVAEKYLTDNQQ